MSVYTLFWIILFGTIYFLPIILATLMDNLFETNLINQTQEIGNDKLIDNQNHKQIKGQTHFEINKNVEKNLQIEKNKKANSLDFTKFWANFSKSEIIQKSWILVAALFVILVCYLVFHKNIFGLSFANFGLHFGGGMACGLIFEYFLQVFDKLQVKLNFLTQLILLYFLVSGLGVGSELLEFLLDLVGNLPFSTDRFDTWFDLTANTIGAISIWLVIYFTKKFYKNLHKTWKQH